MLARRLDQALTSASELSLTSISSYVNKIYSNVVQFTETKHIIM